MIYIALMGIMTFASSFMVADTLHHVLRFPVEELSVLFFSIWSGAVILSLVDRNWMTSLGFFHIFVFLVCATKVYRGNFGGHEKDFIKFPLRFFAPLFLGLFFGHFVW